MDELSNHERRGSASSASGVQDHREMTRTRERTVPIPAQAGLNPSAVPYSGGPYPPPVPASTLPPLFDTEVMGRMLARSGLVPSPARFGQEAASRTQQRQFLQTRNVGQPLSGPTLNPGSPNIYSQAYAGTNPMVARGEENQHPYLLPALQSRASDSIGIPTSTPPSGHPQNVGRPRRPEPKTEEEMTFKISCQICMEQIADVACVPCGTRPYTKRRN